LNPNKWASPKFCVKTKLVRLPALSRSDQGSVDQLHGSLLIDMAGNNLDSLFLIDIGPFDQIRRSDVLPMSVGIL